MKLLTCYQGHTADVIEKKDKTEVVLCSLNGSQKLDLYCYAEIESKNGKPFLYTAELPILVEARDAITGETFIVFDQAIHGYDAIVCGDFADTDLTIRKPLKKLITAEKVISKLHYAIDYEDEKDDYDFDENGKVKTDSGKVYDWEYLKANGIDWIELFYVDVKGKKIKFLDFELA